jgi:M6 family metalloprotease-like protein
MISRMVNFVFCLMLIVGLTQAAPLYNQEMLLTQPDGSTIECLASGDEYYNYLHDADGYTIIQSQQDGFYYFAEKPGDTILPSEYRVDSVNPQNVNLERGVIIDRQEYLDRRESRFPNPISVTRDTRTNTGTLNNLVVYIRFSDQSEFQLSRGAYDLKFNADGEGAISLYTYYHEVSYQSLEIISQHFPICEMNVNLSYVDSHPRDYYSPYNFSSNPIGYSGNDERTSREHELLVNAVNFIAAEVPIDLDIDHNNDNLVDNVCFVIRGGNDGWAELLWAHRWSLFSQEVYIHDKRVLDYTFQPETQNDISTLCHEMFHALGAPDLYHYNNSNYSPFGSWDIMNSGFGHMSAHMKYRYGGWIQEVPELVESGTYYLQPLLEAENNCYRISIPGNENEFIMLEYRKRVSGSYEENLPDSGLLIYRVNTLYEGNAQGPPDELYLFRPGGSPNSGGSVNGAGFSADSGRDTFSDYTDPYGFLTDGSLAGVVINDIGWAEDSISFRFAPGLGNLSGYVSGPEENFDVTQVLVSASGFETYPDETGFYELELHEGDYELSAFLAGFTSPSFEISILTDENLEIDLELGLLAVPYDLSADIEDDVLELNWLFDDFENPEFEQVNIYIYFDGLSDWFSIGASDSTYYTMDLTPIRDYSFRVTAEYSNGESAPSDSVNIIFTDITTMSTTPAGISLGDNYPNPFNPETTISYSILTAANVKLEVFDILGRSITLLEDAYQAAGEYQHVFTAEDLVSGVYFYRLQSGDVIQQKKMLLIK